MITFDRLELQRILLTLEAAIASGEGARVLVAELLQQVASVASSTDLSGR